ncbi:hypothetical protein G6L37_06200 [Agrobacterium rubi]|nr:hypothetical protein [Agrobacterium rubi]NTF24953.1 hypothetical protein [Agrobacterium rubi]
MTNFNDLSEAARIVAGCSFSMSPGASIRYQMIQSVPSAEMQAALDELVSAGIVLRDDEPHGPVSYTASRTYDFSEARRYAFDRTLNGDVPTIRIFIPKELAAAEAAAKSST